MQPKTHKSYIYTSIICLSILCVCLFIPFAYAQEFQSDGSIDNVVAYTSHTLTKTHAESAFERIQVQFSQDSDSIIYSLHEQKNSANAYSTLKVTFSEDILETAQISLKIPLQNEVDITQDSLRIFKAPNVGGDIAPVQHTIIRVDANHIYANVRLPNPEKAFVLYVAAEGFTKPNVGAVTESPQQEDTQNQQQLPQGDGIIDSQSSEAQAQVTLNIRDTSQTQSFPLAPVLIGAGIILVIVLVIISVIHKHKVGPTNVKQVDSPDLAKEVREAIAKQKSNGLIVSELINKKYELIDIIAELEKQGRSVTKNIK